MRLGLHPFFAPKNGWNKKHKSYFAAVSFFICLRRVLPGRGQLWRQSCTNRSPERHSLINCRVQPERANSSLRSSDSARFVAASLTLIIRVVMVRFWLDAVINVGFSFLYFYIINIIITCQTVILNWFQDLTDAKCSAKLKAGKMLNTDDNNGAPELALQHDMAYGL